MKDYFYAGAVVGLLVGVMVGITLTGWLSHVGAICHF